MIDYLWDEKWEDYQSSGSSGHIFLDLNELKLWLESQSSDSTEEPDQRK